MDAPSRLIDNLAAFLISIFVIATWMMGIVLAPGWWKIMAGVNPFYAWYLVVEYFMKYSGMIM